MKKVNSLLIIFLSFGFVAQFFAQTIDSPEITAAEIQAHINYLASDELKGRDTGTEQCLEAARYIENEFKKYGLLPFFDESYMQEFPFISAIQLTDNNALAITLPNTELNPVLHKDYITVPFSGNADVDAEIVFAGFGISAPELEYDDYENLDVEGKVVVVLRNHPDQDNPHSEFDKFSPLRKKSSVARDKGAVGIIFVNGYEEFKQGDDLVDFTYDRGGAVTGFAIANVKREIIEEIFNSKGMSFKTHNENIIAEKKPASFIFENANAKLSTGVEEIETISWNVAGFIPGNGLKYANEYVVLGAHFDHLGMGGSNSLYQGDNPQVHNGADDNASGTTGLLELAEKFASVQDKLNRSILFVAFSGEEYGLLGSSYFVNNMPINADQVATMINMDMIGRLNDEKSLIVYGTGTSTDWKDVLNDINVYDFSLTFNDDGYGPSDHSSFYAKEIPVLFFFTGTHTDYHKPSDDADKIEAAGEEIVLKYIFDLTSFIDRLIESPVYLLVEKKDMGQMPGRKVWVGTIPDFAGEVDGYKISGVSEGGPAQLAGLQGGDIIIKFGEKKITNIYDFTYALADFVPGDKVVVVVKRGEEELTFELTLRSK
ncbi:MAG: M28 family peptidase [Ignavibacteriaceae bacterium]